LVKVLFDVFELKFVNVLFIIIINIYRNK
jgi:hypothetical protein